MFTRDAGSELNEQFDIVFPSILERIQPESNWSGCLVTDPDNGFSYERINYGFELSSPGKRNYRVGVNLFIKGELVTAWHNHRFPFLVYPLALDGEPGAAVYEMDWKDAESGQAGVMLVVSGERYSIQRCGAVFHRVRSLRNHLSINIADVTDPPARPDHTVVHPLSDSRVSEILQMLKRAVTSDRFEPPALPLGYRLLSALQ